MMFTIQRHCSGSVRKEPEGVQVLLREREKERESSSLTCKGNLKENPPTPASSYTHAREPAAQSGLSSRATAERERAAAFCTPATARRSTSIKLLIFSTRKFINLLNLQSTIHPLHIKFIHGPLSRIVGEDIVMATRKKNYFYLYIYLLRLLSSDVEIASSSFRYASKCSWS